MDNIQLVNDKNGSGFQDISFLQLNQQTRFCGDFELKIGIGTPEYSVLKQPFGHTTCYVITEHCCWTDFNLAKAVYFGNSDKNTQKGLIHNNIKTTISVFLSNPDDLNNEPQTIFDSSKQFALFNNPQAIEFIQKLIANGYEIAIHGFENYGINNKSSSLEQISKLLSLAHKYNIRFSALIDHLAYPVIDNNATREKRGIIENAISGDARNNGLYEFYLDNNINIFWNCANDILSIIIILISQIQVK